MHTCKVYAMHVMDIAKYIKDLRKKLGMTQLELGEEINSNRDNIANYEVGRAIPPGDVLLKIQALDPDRKAI